MIPSPDRHLDRPRVPDREVAFGPLAAYGEAVARELGPLWESMCGDEKGINRPANAVDLLLSGYVVPYDAGGDFRTATPVSCEASWWAEIRRRGKAALRWGDSPAQDWPRRPEPEAMGEESVRARSALGSIAAE